MHAIQEVFVAEEWIKDARKETQAEVQLHTQTTKALGAAKQENQELANKLIAEERAWKSAESGLKGAQDQAEDQRKQLHLKEIDLATQSSWFWTLKLI